MVRHAPIHRRSGHSDIAICCGRNVRGSSPSTSVVPLSNQIATLNHKRFKGFKMFSDGHSGMSAEALMDLRTRVDEVLLKRRADIERQLERMGSAITVVGGRDGGSTLKGKKVPPKYRGPSGETWAGRGVRPRWLVAAIKGGKKLDDFLIDKSAPKGRKKRRSKR